MPIIDSFPPLFPASSAITAFGFPANYYGTPEDQLYYTPADFSIDPKQMTNLGISDNTLLRQKYYTSEALVVTPVDLRFHFPLDPNLGGNFATLLREDDNFVGKISKNTYLLSSLGISLSTLTAASAGNVLADNISLHTPTTATFTNLLAVDPNFATRFVNYNVNPSVITGLAGGKSPTVIQAALSTNQTLSQLLTAFYITSNYTIRSGTRTYFTNAAFKTNFNKQFVSYLDLDSNTDYVDQKSNISNQITQINKIDSFVESTVKALKYDGIVDFTAFEGSSGNRYAPVTYSTRTVFNTGTIPGDPFLDPSNFSLANVFYNRTSLIQYLTSIAIDTINLSTINLSAQSLTAETLTYKSLNKIGDDGSIIPSVDYLPLTGGTMTGAILYGNGARLDQGRQDTMRGGNSGISLVCSIDYDLNWQAGWLASFEQDRTTNRPLYFDSGAGTTVRVWSGVAVNDGINGKGTEISHTGLTAEAGLFTVNLSTASFTANTGVFNTGLSAVSLSATALNALSSTFTDINVTNAITASSLNVTNLSATSSTFNNINVTNAITTSSLNVTNLSTTGTFYYTTIQKIDNNGNTVPGGVNEDGLSCVNLTATNALITNLTAINLSANIGVFNTSISSNQITGLEGIYAKKFYTYNENGVPVEFVGGGGGGTSITDPLSISGVSCINLTATNIYSENLSGNNYYFNNVTAISSLIAPGLTSINVDNAIKIDRDIVSTEDIVTTKDISAANIYGNIIGDQVNVGESNILNYLSAQRATIDQLTSADVSIQSKTIAITSEIIDDILGPIIETTLVTLGGNLFAVNTETVNLTADNTSTAYLTCYNSISLVSSVSGFTPVTVFYASTAGKVGINTSNPLTELSIVGNVSASGFLQVGDASSKSLYTTSISAQTIEFTNTINTLTGSVSTLSGTIYGVINNSQYDQVNLFKNVSVSSLTAISFAVLTAISTPRLTAAELISTNTGNSNLWTSAYYTPVTINLILDGMGSTVKTGVRGRVEIPFNMNLSAWSLYADNQNLTNSTSVTVVSSTFDNYPDFIPLHLDSNSIPKLNIGEIKKTQEITELNWNIELQQGDILQFGLMPEILGDNSNAPISATHLTLAIRGSRRQ
jgi:hypothetical protein